MAAHDRDKPLASGLYLVATPIGNLEDITLRALRVLRLADRIACEDTRQTGKLLHHFGIETPLVSYHLFNESARARELAAELAAGATIAVVSDAGTPGIADPGAQLAAAAIAAGVSVFSVPGANAALAALVASGLPAERFTFHGFLPSKAGQRLSTLEQLPRDAATHVFYESPHRIVEALGDVATVFGPEQAIVLARELTKLHEEFLRGPVTAIRNELSRRPQVRGEMVLMLHVLPAEPAADASSVSVLAAVKTLMTAEAIDEMAALKRVARERGIGKSVAYRELQREQAKRKT